MKDKKAPRLKVPIVKPEGLLMAIKGKRGIYTKPLNPGQSNEKTSKRKK